MCSKDIAPCPMFLRGRSTTKILEREPHGINCANAVMKRVRVALMCCVEKRLLLRLE